MTAVTTEAPQTPVASPHPPAGVAEALLTLPDDIMRHVAKGLTLGDLAGLEEAEYEAMYTLGHTMYTQQRYTEASSIFGFLVTHNHLERRFIKAYASSLQMCGDHVNAIRLHSLTALLDPADLQPCLHSCECLMALGLKTEAAEGLAMVIRQCEREEQEPLRAQAHALLSLLAESTNP